MFHIVLTHAVILLCILWVRGKGMMSRQKNVGLSEWQHEKYHHMCWQLFNIFHDWSLCEQKSRGETC
jgi:hypothetical protein